MLESSSDVLAVFRDPKAIRLRYRLAWVLFAVNVVVVAGLYALMPGDRDFLEFILFACTGPLLCHGASISSHPAVRWIRARKIDRILFVILGSIMMWRAFTGGRRVLFIFTLLGMGPLMFMANVRTGLEVYEAMQKRSENPQNDRLS